MGRTRDSPEETHFQANLSNGDTEHSDSNSSNIANNGTPDPPTRTIKIRFFDELSPSEQKKYASEQQKMAEQRQAALTGLHNILLVLDGNSEMCSVKSS